MGPVTGSEHSRTRTSGREDQFLPRQSDILAQVERIVNSKVFAGSDRLCRFLTWTVQRRLKGKAEEIKQYTIGREVFDRGTDFDPRIDSIVRTEAQRLRRKLSEYYQSDGATDPILILFEPGSYIPVIKRREASGLAEKPRGPEVVSIDIHRRRVAILPFSNLNADTDQEYLCYGIADDIQMRLASSPALIVIATSSAFRFTSADHDVARIGRDLGVNTLVQGSVQRAGTRIRIRAGVIDVASRSYIWARVFDREIQDVFALQDEIAHAVAGALTQRMEPEADAPVSVPPMPDAYKLYLRGRYFWNQVSVEGCEKAEDCFQRAISIYPDYAQAYAALAEVYHWLIFFQVRRPVAMSAVSRRLTLEALRLDPHCAEAHVALGMITAALEWRWDEAESCFRRGLELRPNYLLGYVQRSFCRLHRGDLEGSRADVEKALDLDPLSVRSHRTAALRLYLLRDYSGALNALEGALELGPDIKNTWYYLGLTLLKAGRFTEAIAAIHKSLDPATQLMHLGALVAVYAAAGDSQKAEEVLQQLHELSARSFAPPLAFVYAYAGTGQKSEALNWLERAADQRYTGLLQIKLDPMLDNLRDEPRFQAVLDRMHIA